MMISLTNLPVLQITGADAVSFAHAQFSSDVRGLADGAGQWSSWLSPAGRVRAFFHLLRDDAEHLRLLLRGGDAQELRVALAPYVLRAKVSLSVADAHVSGSNVAPAAQTGVIALPGSPPRWLVLGSEPAPSRDSPDELEAWRLADIRAGLPEIAPQLSDQLLPQWLGLDRIGAISVRKGCYPGQEVMSRLHFKGGNKRSLYRVELTATAAPPAGTALRTAADDAEAGHWLMAARRDADRFEALASLVDAVSEQPLHVVPLGIKAIEVRQRFE